ncbi:hypothetical protein Slin14017_G068350 [Septoria linicola]|nr:hypothetical protein Slin14017_G068350 [Septoria linicola]
MLGTNTSTGSGSGVLCSTCATTFESTFDRREHMRGAWHVFNVKRRVDSMPPVPLTFYLFEVERVPSRARQTAVVAGFDHDGSKDNLDGVQAGSNAGQHTEDTPLAADEDQTRSGESDSTSEPDEITVACLFCTEGCDDMDDALSHMQAVHGFVVPRPDDLATDIETFISYLTLVIDTYHACLFCGNEKHSAEAVRSHMLAKAHCQLDLSEQSDFLDFWLADESRDHESQMQAIPSTHTELRLSSGFTVTKKGYATNRPKRHANPVDENDHFGAKMRSSVQLQATTPRLSNSCSDLTSSSGEKHTTTALARRDALGAVGLSESQKRSLAVTQRKAKTTEDRATNKARWTLENMGNKVKQKHFKVGSMCRSGIFIDPTMF